MDDRDKRGDQGIALADQALSPLRQRQFVELGNKGGCIRSSSQCGKWIGIEIVKTIAPVRGNFRSICLSKRMKVPSSAKATAVATIRSGLRCKDAVATR